MRTITLTDAQTQRISIALINHVSDFGKIRDQLNHNGLPELADRVQEKIDATLETLNTILGKVQA